MKKWVLWWHVFRYLWDLRGDNTWDDLYYGSSYITFLICFSITCIPNTMYFSLYRSQISSLVWASIFGPSIVLFFGNPNMTNTLYLPFWSPSLSGRRKQLQCAAIMRENHLNITLSTLNLIYTYITNASNSSRISYTFYSLLSVHSRCWCITESSMPTNAITNSRVKMARTWFLI